MEPSEKPHHEHSHGPTTDHTALDSSEVAECPVMRGTMVVKTEAEEDGLVREYGGQLYYLCCDSCGTLWDASPEQYAG